MCSERSPFIFSKYRPASLAKMDVKIENSEDWQINNADIPCYVKRNRFTIVIIAMGAARHGSSAAAEEFKYYNLLSRNCDHFVKWDALSKKESDQVKLHNILRLLRHGIAIKTVFGQSEY